VSGYDFKPKIGYREMQLEAFDPMPLPLSCSQIAPVYAIPTALFIEETEHASSQRN
jgi:hypothetical protein